MRCVICRTGELSRRMVEEEIRVDNDVLLVKVSVLACDSCGERYYDRATMRRLEEVETKLRTEPGAFSAIGRVLVTSI